ncbi:MULTISPECIES: MTAP family purine nucleoside phosphorylase [unclassified Methanoregula]|uniref:MTAP family purine nucleoside phosphorylase n=1 Tax=unclassified Methanoregula TaxID=2649730 RepID=UPI0009C5CF91|nr:MULTISPECIES: MTAP family purine nucleoside phosphorylase [unclassified Methanoregula]OPX62977.1 MAG: putative 6-oxopurine nucleoside phosphorylase [Methanoregula sp. PtaB.Bin085]OPY35190.1 MAG: putative 6-oxopurine nucleoside phosphorylase [Methanoregula sp. PtaU1.Bin006]
MLGIIGGTSLMFSELPHFEKRQIATPFGNATILAGDNVALLMRHQNDLPPHRINFRANLAALAIAGVDRIVAFGSSGSLNHDIAPGSLVIPTDYVSMTAIPSIHDHAVAHVMPELSPDLSQELRRLVPAARLGGTYLQTWGPRFETVAEIAVFSRFADLVGMTLASEATLARELSIPFAAICTVDNYANGLADGILTWDEVLAISRQFRERTAKILDTIMQQMA